MTDFSWIGKPAASTQDSFGLQLSWASGYSRPYTFNDTITWQGESGYTYPAYNDSNITWYSPPDTIVYSEALYGESLFGEGSFGDVGYEDTIDFDVLGEGILGEGILAASDFTADTLAAVAGETYTVSIPTSVENFEIYTVSIPTSVDNNYGIYTLSVATSITLESANWHLSIPTAVRLHETFSTTINSQVVVRETQFSLSIPAAVENYEAHSLSLSAAIAVLPVFTSGVGSQGVGGVVQLPVNNSQVWSLQVLIAGVDVSARLTDKVTVDIEESSARVASFILKPEAGAVNPYSWVQANAEIYYILKDTDGNPVVTTLLFNGIVDTPEYDVATRLTHFTCTDNLQHVVGNYTKASLAALTPLAQYSKFVFDETANSWDYLQDRLSTYFYAIRLDLNGNLVVYDYRAAEPLYEFQVNTIIDGSLSVSLANAREIVNYCEVTLESREDVFRETDVNVSWNDPQYDVEYPSWWFAEAAMAVSALEGTGSVFYKTPIFKIQRESHQAHDGLLTYFAMNYGVDLTLVGIRGSLSKRFTQSVTTARKVIVQDAQSISQLGILKETVNASVSVEYASDLSSAFTETLSRTEYLCSAGNTYQTPTASANPEPGDPLLFVSDGTSGGWVPYPRYPISYTTWKNDPSILGDLASYRRTVTSEGILIESTDSPTGYPGYCVPGEYLYDLSSFIINGTELERTGAYDCLVAKAKQLIVNSHRQNQVKFSTYINPAIGLGQTIRVATDALTAMGVVQQLNHTFDIGAGTAITEVTLAVSMSNAIGLGVVVNPFRLSMTTNVIVSNSDVQSSIPMDTSSFSHYVTLDTDYTGSGLASYVFNNNNWGGFFTRPSDASSGDLSFTVEFPELSTTNTDNAEVTVLSNMIDASVPNNELLLVA